MKAAAGAAGWLFVRPGREAARKFRLYWLFVRPGSGLIRWIWLAAIRRRTEADIR